MSDYTALIIAITALYSTGHWIGATTLLAWIVFCTFIPDNDPLGLHALQAAMRKYRE